MKRSLLIAAAMLIAASSFAQFDRLMKLRADVIAPANQPSYTDFPISGEQIANSYVSIKSNLDDPVTCITRYDMQTNSSNQKRIYLFPDGTIGAVATWSQQDGSWSDRGTGYNYFNGTTWGTQPTSRVETIRTGWGEYHPFGAGGEIIIAHQSIGPLVMNTRSVKGEGNWVQTVLPALPSNITGMFWPRSITNGTNHTNIHIIALTLPTGNGGQVYNGMDGALLYCKSTDGGTTWTNWTQLAGTGTADYLNYTADTYSWADPKGDTIAFTCGSSWKDQFIMKSTDNGTTWVKTVVYASPYNLGGNSPGFFYCPDGTMSVALDNEGMAHVVFGMLQDSGSPEFGYYRPYTCGIAYWNEYQSQLRQDLDPDSLNSTGNLVGWIKDTMVFHPPSGVGFASYKTSLTSNPELLIENNGKVFLFFDGLTTVVDPDNYTLRHIFARNGFTFSGNTSWCQDTMIDVTSDWVQYQYAECVYPSVSPTFDEKAYILFQKDDYAGSYVRNMNGCGGCGQDFPDDNSMTVIGWLKPFCPPGIINEKEKPAFSVAQNIPNPVNGFTKVNVYLQNTGELKLRVRNLTGQTMIELEKNIVLPGVSQFMIDVSQLAPGVYFYTVSHGGQSVTKKMVVN